MDDSKYYAVTHRLHHICNPTTKEKLSELFELCQLRPSSRVLDIACGKGELIVSLIERYGIAGVALDLSSDFMAEAEKKRTERIPSANLTLLKKEASSYKPSTHEPFDLAMCLGASWIYGDHRDTLQELRGFVRPGGLIVTGEPFWRRPPAPEYLEREGYRENEFSTHYGNVAVGEEEGLNFLYGVVSSKDDFDRYEGLQWYATSDYLHANPSDPDADELSSRVAHSRDSYLLWGREELGWALYLFRAPAISDSS